MQYARRLRLLGLASLLWSAPPAAANASDAPLELTILRTVNLPWQEPEAILTAKVDLESLEVTVGVDGAFGEAQTL